MNHLLALVLLANLAFAHLPPTPVSLRRSAAHKKRLDDQYLPSAVALHRRVSIGDILNLDDNVQILGQSPDGAVSAVVNGDTTTFPADPTQTPPSDTTSSSESPAPTPSPPLSSDPPPSSSTPEPTPSPSDPVTSSSQDCGLLGLFCPPSSDQNPSSTEPPPAQSPSNPPGTSDQVSQPPPTSSDQAPPGTTGDLCLLLGIGCPPSQSPTSSNPAPTQPPPASSDPAPPTTTGDLCLLLGIGCPPSSTPVSSNPAPTQPPPVSSDSVGTQQPPPTTGDLCLLLGIGCPPSSTGGTVSPPVSGGPTETQQPPPTTTGDLCLLLGIGCPPSSSPANSGSISSQPPPAASDTVSPGTTGDLCLLLGIGCPLSSTQSISASFPSFTQPPSSEPLFATGTSLPPDSSISIPSTTAIIFPTESSSLPSSSIPGSLSITPTSSVPPTNTQFEWLTQTSLIFSSIAESTSDSLSLTDPDQVPTSTSFSTGGTPSVAPSVAPLPSGIPARIIPGAGGVNPEVDNLNGFTLIAVLFDRGLNWDTVVHNPDSPGQIFSWLPVLIQTALGVTSDQVKSFALQVWIPNSYRGPSDISLLGTTWLGYIPTPLVQTLAAQIKVKTSSFYTGQPSPYSDLASHVDPSFDIMTVTATTGIPGSGGSNGSSSGDTSDDSRTRQNAIIGVVSALGGMTLIVLGYLIYRAIQKRRELAHRRLSDPPTNPFIGEAPPNRNFDQDSIGGQRRRSFYFAEDSLRGLSDHNYTNDGARLSPEQTLGLNRRPIAGNIGPPVMRENSLNF